MVMMWIQLLSALSGDERTKGLTSEEAVSPWNCDSPNGRMVRVPKASARSSGVSVGGTLASIRAAMGIGLLERSSSSSMGWSRGWGSADTEACIRARASSSS